MNIYSYKFECKCPNNGILISYELEIQSSKMIQVETIVKECDNFTESYHENMADKLHIILGQRQTMTAHHHGVTIKTIRG